MGCPENTRTAARRRHTCPFTCRTPPCSFCLRDSSHLDVELWHLYPRVFINFAKVPNTPTSAQLSGDHTCVFYSLLYMWWKCKPVFFWKHCERGPALLTKWYLQVVNIKVNSHCVSKESSQHEQTKITGSPTACMVMCVWVYWLCW